MKIGLLGRILIAIALGVALGHVFTLPWVRIFVTFNSIFGQFLGFIIPLIILGLVTPAIADIGKGAGKLLLITVGIAYADTVIAAILSYTTGTTFFPSLIGNGAQTLDPVEKSAEILPYFTVNIPAALDVMSALVLSFIMGLGIAYHQRDEGHYRGGYRARYHPPAARLYLRHLPQYDLQWRCNAHDDGVCKDYCRYLRASHFCAYLSISHCWRHCAKESLPSLG